MLQFNVSNHYLTTWMDNHACIGGGVRLYAYHCMTDHILMSTGTWLDMENGILFPESFGKPNHNANIFLDAFVTNPFQLIVETSFCECLQ
jgi:hypothetical protein